MLPTSDPDRIEIAFDDDRLVADAGLLLPATLAQHLGLQELADSYLDLGDAPGRANAGDKLRSRARSEQARVVCGVSQRYPGAAPPPRRAGAVPRSKYCR